MTTLLVDVGNTRIKWRVNGEPMQHGESLDACFAAWSRYGIRTVGLAATGKQDIVHKIQAHVNRTFPQSTVHVFHSEKRFRSLVNSYSDPDSMGVDRWMALIAAHENYPGNCLIFDAGSALTVDCLRKDGHHLGGWIVPGLSMMRKALLTRTARVRDAAQDSTVPFGASTGTAVSIGTRNALVATCKCALDQANRLVSVDHILLAGGDCDVLRAEFENLSHPSVLVRPELVLDGLALGLDKS